MEKAPKAKCDECPLRAEPFVPGYGGADAKFVVLGEAPGQQEVKEGKPFVGPSGQVLWALLGQAGVLQDQVYASNSVLCRPPDNREPTELELSCCRPRLIHELDEHQAAKVIALGKTAMGAVGLAGRSLWDDTGRYIGAYHPAYILRNPNDILELYETLYKAVHIPKREPLNPNVIVVKDPTEAAFQLGRYANHGQNKHVIVDLETRQNRWRIDPILCMQMAMGTDEAVVIPGPILRELPTAGLQRFFDDLPNWGGHNIKFDMNFLAYNFPGLKLKPRIDTMLMHYCLKETQGGHGLKELTTLFFDVPDYESQLIKPYLRSKGDMYDKIPVDVLYKYGGLDVCYNWELVPVLEPRVRENGLWQLYEKLMEGTWELHKMEQRGVRVDRHALTELSDRLEIECGEHEDAMQGIIDELQIEPTIPTGWSGDPEKFLRILERIEDDFNPSSSQQVQVLLFDILKFPEAQGGRKKKDRSADADILHMFEDKHPFVKELMAYRRKQKLKSSYCENLLEALDENDRVHPRYLIHGTETGRLSAQDPAVQTIPRPGTDDPLSALGGLIRRSFVAKPGYKFIVVDYSQAELRVAAALSGEPYLLQAFKERRNVHSETARGMFGDGFTQEDRHETKRLVFCFLYGGVAENFASDYAVPIDKAKKMFNRLKEFMPGLVAYKDVIYQELRSKGYVETRPLKRRRRVPLITDRNVKEAKKIALNSPIQGGAHDLTLLSFIECGQAGIETVIEIHDAILAEAPEAIAVQVGEQIASTMVRIGETYYPEVPWVAEVKIGDCWS